jgi:hypothetical protein
MIKSLGANKPKNWTRGFEDSMLIVLRIGHCLRNDCSEAA